MTRRRTRALFFRLTTICMSLLVMAGLAELTLRLLPVSELYGTQAVNDSNPILRYRPNRQVVWSRQWNFALRNQLRINNYGFVNNEDYVADDASPLIAVIGDSYVEAAMVPPTETLAGRLATEARSKRRVYSFATSGAPLSQYLALADFTRHEFKPTGMIFVIVHNDFDESLLADKSAPGFHYFVPDGETGLDLSRVDSARSGVRDLVARSALVRYLFLNLEIRALPRRVARRKLESELTARTMAKRLDDSKLAVDAFLGKLPDHCGLEVSRVLFLVDGPRALLYEEQGAESALESSYFLQIRRYFISQAEKRGYEVIDMFSRFAEHYEMNRKRFDFEIDRHWNSLAHRLASSAVMESRFGPRVGLIGSS